MRVKIEDMRDWLMDYYFDNPTKEMEVQHDADDWREYVLEWTENMEEYEVAEEYVRLKFNDTK